MSRRPCAAGRGLIRPLLVLLTALATAAGSAFAAGTLPALVFVSRAIPENGSDAYAPARAQPGAGPRTRFAAAAPGQLVVRAPDGRLRVLVDGRRPGPASLDLVDVNAPDVSYDGRRIVFAGLTRSAAGRSFGPAGDAGGWRLYVIDADGGGLRRLTADDPGRAAKLAAAGLSAAFEPFDDGDPAWLPNGDIVFSSTRYPSYAHFGGVRTTNLYTVRSDGSRLARITTERNGADRPLVDPVTGRIVYARWWRNHRLPADNLSTRTDPDGGYVRRAGLTTDPESRKPLAAPMVRNAWHAATIDPDGTHLAMWGGVQRDEVANQFYGGSFDAAGRLHGNFAPVTDLVDAAGFGGVRRHLRSAGGSTAVIGVTTVIDDPAWWLTPDARGIYRVGDGGVAVGYAADPCVLPDGRLVVSLAKDAGQDYGLVLADADGGRLVPLLDRPGASELRTKVLAARPLPKVRPSGTGTPPIDLPPPAAGPLDRDGRFEFHAHNIYFNAPVDTEIVSAPAVGSAASIRFHADFQRSSPGTAPSLDWPLLVDEVKVLANGAVPVTELPAGVPLFEQLRSADRKVPAVGGAQPAASDGSAHVAGLNFGTRGDQALCVGCHAGHTQIPLPENIEASEYTNLAPGAQAIVSSSRDARADRGLVDRRARTGDIWRTWTSAPGATAGQWVRLVFPVPVRVKAVRLYNPRSGDAADSSLQVEAATVDLCADADCAQRLASAGTGPLSTAGTDVPFRKVVARAVQVRIERGSGTFQGAPAVGLAEVEVIARGEAP